MDKDRNNVLYDIDKSLNPSNILQNWYNNAIDIMKQAKTEEEFLKCLFIFEIICHIDSCFLDSKSKINECNVCLDKIRITKRRQQENERQQIKKEQKERKRFYLVEKIKKIGLIVLIIIFVGTLLIGPGLIATIVDHNKQVEEQNLHDYKNLSFSMTNKNNGTYSNSSYITNLKIGIKNSCSIGIYKIEINLIIISNYDDEILWKGDVTGYNIAENSNKTYDLALTSSNDKLWNIPLSNWTIKLKINMILFNDNYSMYPQTDYQVIK